MRLALLAAAFLLHAGSAAAGGDAGSGAAIYERCGACHSLEQDRAGPRHCGLIGRRAGSVKDYPYSEAMKRSGIVWSEATLERFLADPGKLVPGTPMAAFGVSDAKERADVIAYLARANASAQCRSR